jgi:integrase
VVLIIMGIAGACRREELAKMTLDHISDKDSMLVVDVGDTKKLSRQNIRR